MDYVEQFGETETPMNGIHLDPETATANETVKTPTKTYTKTKAVSQNASKRGKGKRCLQPATCKLGQAGYKAHTSARGIFARDKPEPAPPIY